MDKGLNGTTEAPVPLAVEVQVLINGVPVTWRRDPNHVPPPGISEANVADILAGLRAIQMIQRQYSGLFAGKGDVMLTSWEGLPYAAAITKAIQAAGLHHEAPMRPTTPALAASAAKFGKGAIQVTSITPPATMDIIRDVREAYFHQTTDGPQVWFTHGDTVYKANVVGNNTATMATSQAVYFVAKHQAHNMIELSVEPVGAGWHHTATATAATPAPVTQPPQADQF